MQIDLEIAREDDNDGPLADVIIDRILQEYSLSNITVMITVYCIIY